MLDCTDIGNNYDAVKKKEDKEIVYSCTQYIVLLYCKEMSWVVIFLSTDVYYVHVTGCDCLNYRCIYRICHGL